MDEQYLREELNTRVSSLYSHSNTTITFVITIWSTIIALISVFHERLQDNLKWLTLIVPLIFLITSFYIFFAAQKFNENLSQVNNIAAYLCCFHNIPLSQEGLLNKNGSSWEYSTLELQSKSVTNSKQVLFHMNGEYVFFSIISAVIELVISVGGIYWWKNDLRFCIILLVYSVILLITNIVLILRISKLTSLKHITEQKINQLTTWIQYGIQKGVFSKAEAQKRFGAITTRIKQ